MSSKPSNKAHTLQHENHSFIGDWEEKCFQIEMDNKAHYLLCHVVISSIKSFNVERHYKIHSAKYDYYRLLNQGRESWSHLSQHANSKQVQ